MDKKENFINNSNNKKSEEFYFNNDSIKIQENLFDNNINNPINEINNNNNINCEIYKKKPKSKPKILHKKEEEKIQEYPLINNINNKFDNNNNEIEPIIYSSKRNKSKERNHNNNNNNIFIQENEDRIADALGTQLIGLDANNEIIQPTAEEIQALAEQEGIDANILAGSINERIDDIQTVQRNNRQDHVRITCTSLRPQRLRATHWCKNHGDSPRQTPSSVCQ